MALILLSCNSDSPEPSNPPALIGTVSITGTPQVGQTLTADTSALGGSGEIIYYWWRNGITGIGGNSSTYTLVNADLDSTIRIRVTRSGYSGYVTSDATAIVTPDPGSTIPPSASENFTYILNSTVTIIGYNGPGGSISIPASIDGRPVTAIEYMAFADRQLASVVIPNSVTFIGDEAFAGNVLTTVSIPNSVTSIGKGAFSDNYLTSVTISNRVTTIGDGAFNYNYLTSVAIPSSVTSIGNAAFAENRLTSVSLSNSLTSIGESAFESNDLTGVSIPNSVTSIGRKAFATNQLRSVTISNSVSAIQYSTFYDNSLTNVTIPNSVTSIGENAFFYNDLISITIGANVTLSSGSFENNGFESAYNAGGRLAGRYTRPNTSSTAWNRQ